MTFAQSFRSAQRQQEAVRLDPKADSPNFGALMMGNPGSGKSLLTRMMAMQQGSNLTSAAKTLSDALSLNKHPDMQRLGSIEDVPGRPRSCDLEAFLIWLDEIVASSGAVIFNPFTLDNDTPLTGKPSLQNAGRWLLLWTVVHAYPGTVELTNRDSLRSWLEWERRTIASEWLPSLVNLDRTDRWLAAVTVAGMHPDEARTVPDTAEALEAIETLNALRG